MNFADTASSDPVDVCIHAQNRNALSRVGWRGLVVVDESNATIHLS